MIRRLSALMMVAVVLAGAVLADDPAEEGKAKPFELKRKKRGNEAPVKQPDDTDPDEPPVKAKGKGKGKVTPPAEKDDPFKGKGKKGPGAGKKGADEPPEPEDGKGEPEEDDQEVLERLSQRMRSVEDMLSNREVGEPTVQEQDDIIKDLDKLINKKNQQNQQNQGGAQQQQQNQDQQKGGQQQKGGMGQPKGGSRGMGQPKGGSGQQKKTARRKKRQPRPLRGQRQDKQMAKGNGTQTPMPKAGQSGNNPMPPMGDGNGTDTGEKLPDKKLYNDVWGHLPETLRAEMNAYSNPRPFMPRYDDLIKKYYRMIAEQGRKKGE